jgi:hypothetical protein
LVEMKIYLTNKLNERFRKIAMNVFGYGRGSLSRAAEEALAKWCTEHADSPEKAEPAKVESGQSEAPQVRINPDERQPTRSDQLDRKPTGAD